MPATAATTATARSLHRGLLTATTAPIATPPALAGISRDGAATPRALANTTQRSRVTLPVHREGDQ